MRGIAAVVLVAVVAAVALLALNGEGSGSDPLKVDVFGEQYLWKFGYPDDGNGFSDELRVPAGREVQFEMHTMDVPHAFWVPEWKLSEFFGPGEVATPTVTPDKTGTFSAICTESCGILHGAMRAKLVVEPEAQFEKWVADLKRKIPSRYAEQARLDNELETIHQERE